MQDIEIDSEGEVIQSVMMVGPEPVNINEVVNKKVWENAMKEELETLK